MGDIAAFLKTRPLWVHVFSVESYQGSRRFGYLEFRLAGLYFKEDTLVVYLFGFHRQKVPVVEIPVASDAVVDHCSIKGRHKLYSPRPVFGGQRRHLSGNVWKGHVNDAPVLKRADTSMVILEPNEPLQDSASHVQLLAVGKDIYPGQVEPGRTGQAELEGQPVRKIDEVLVFHDVSCDFGFKAVVPACKIGAWIVYAVAFGFCSGAPGCEITISEGAKRFTKFFVFGVESFIGKSPAAHFLTPSFR